MSMLTCLDINPPSREEGLRRLTSIVPKLGSDYAKNRNFDRGIGGHSSVSMLSPWIRHRLLLEEELIREVVAEHGYQAPQKFIQEVFWRTYWKGWLELRPKVWDDYIRERDNAISDFHADVNLYRAVAAKTGIECFDYWVNELKETNYLHNHARMWFASIWIFTLKLPWVLGADFFLKHLIDGDPASNTLSWRWVAGLQTPGKTYLARAENIKKFTEGRFNPKAQLATVASQLSGSPIPTPTSIKVSPPPRSGVKTIWLITEDDLALHEPPIPTNNVTCVAAVNTSNNRALGGVAKRVLSFIEGGIHDATSNFGRQHGVPVEHISMGDPDALSCLIKKHKASQFIVSHIPVGPGRDLVRQIKKTTQDHGIHLTEIIRDWDSLSWPHATKGFFKFKEAIPSILAKMSLA